jgi:hypothetical protein
VTKIVLVLSQSKGGLIAIALKKILKKKDWFHSNKINFAFWVHQ